MSSTNSSDPRMQLPEWLRDGDAPLPSPVESVQVAEPVAIAPEVVVAVAEEPVLAPIPVTPYSDRLSLDTRLDPGQLVSAEDLPSWLGGLERAVLVSPSEVPAKTTTQARTVTTPSVLVVEEPEPYEGVDAPEDGVIDVQMNGWYLLAGAIGLLILLAAALRLYLS